MNKNQPQREGAWIAMLALLIAGMLLLTAPAAAHENNNHGTIKVHDEEEVDPPEQNHPHVDCEFFVEGFNMSDDSGTLVFYSWPPTGDMSEVMNATWEGEPKDGDGFHFLSGPFTLSSGHYRVEAFVDSGHPGGQEHAAKSKMFWVTCEQDGAEPCPSTVDAVANEDGSITVTTTGDPTSDATRLYRAEGSGEFELVATQGPMGGTYEDTNTTVGTTYTYIVTSVYGDEERGPCDRVEVTAIPVFPTVLAAGLATVLGGLGYAGLRRR